MNAFDYHEPDSLDEALALLRRHGEDAHPIAGGTSLILMMRQGLLSPGHLVSLRRLAALRRIQNLSGGGLEIGALATHREIERSELVERFFPALQDPFRHVATIRIRNQATIGGNLAHADPAQDPPPMLLALDAEVVAAGSDGVRIIPLAEFFADFYETALQPGEILTAVRIPPPAAGTRAAYVKFLPQSKDDYATISVAVALRVRPDGTCERARIALGSAGPVPLRVTRAEAALEGKRITEATLDEAAGMAGEDIDPLDDVRGSAAYKRRVAKVWTKRALLQVAEMQAAR